MKMLLAAIVFLMLIPFSGRADPAFDFHNGPCFYGSPSNGASGAITCRPLLGTDIGGTYLDGSSFSASGLTLAKLLSLTSVQESAVSLSGCSGSTATINLALGTYFYCTVSTGGVTFAVSNNGNAGTVSSFVLELTNGGSQTLTWMSGTKWPTGIAPTFTVSGVDLIVCSTRDGAVTWRCTLSEFNSK